MIGRSPEMKGRGSNSSYSAMSEKTFKNAVYHMIESNYGNLGGGKKLTEMMAKDIDEMAARFFVSRDRVKPGQMVMNVVCKSDKPRVGKTMKDTETKSVVVTLFSDEEIRQWINGTSKKTMKMNRMARIAKETYEQTGVTHLGDLSLIQLCCVSTTAKYIHEYENENEEILPYRGTIHDLGPTTTHKEMILEKAFNGKSQAQIKAETGHSSKAIGNYIRGYRRVALLHKNGNPVSDISFLTGLSKRLVQQYMKIGEKYGWRMI